MTTDEIARAFLTSEPAVAQRIVRAKMTLCVPKNATTVALIVTDPDAPSGTFTHWLVWNMPAQDTTIAEGHPPSGTEGQNDYGKSGYGPPCPPSGSHRYVFDVYALDTSLNLQSSARRADVEKAINGHVIAQARVVGTYRKS